MRPILFDVNAAAAQMTLCFPGRPNRYITVRMRSAGITPGTAGALAVAELDALTPLALELLRECARPGDPPPDPEAPALAVALAPVQQVAPPYTGPVFCPACCRRLGTATSPHLGYLRQCSGCQRAIAIQVTPAGIVVRLGSP